MNTLVLLLIGLGGAIAGSLVNWGIYSLGWFQQRAISPWSKPPAGLQRRGIDFVPILGWLSLARDAKHWGRGFWVRPLLIEVALAFALPSLYLLEIRGEFIPPGVQGNVSQSMLLAQFTSHVLLILLMTVATFIDFDEKTIPDWITLPGTLLGLTLITALPYALPPIEFPLGSGIHYPLWLTTSRNWWEEWLDEWPGLLIGTACFAAWCYALIPKTTTLRRGWWKGWLYVHASTFRSPAWRQMGLLALIGAVVILGVWLLSPHGNGAITTGYAWHGLLTSLVGMVFGGGLVWAVRIVGYLGLRKEAMGFGDVTLMAMIGAFLGWQCTIVAFFLAPAVAVIIAVLQFVLTGRRDIAFGPYLCGGALCTILAWPWLWENYLAQIFSLGWMVPALIACILALMLGLLMLIRIFEEVVLGMK